jgi:serine/threonine protein kinase
MADHSESRADASSSVTEDALLREIARAPDSSPPIAPYRRGEVLADRFEIDRLAGAGGMGVVYQALDRLTGTLVALKLATAGATEHERFAQEARTLSELAHPAIVRYVAHGITAQGQPFLAMEWLEGEDLARRFKRAPLSEAESLATVRAVAEGLAAAHTRGVVHRDVKPSNIFLLGGDPWQAKLIDFGIVRRGSSALATTMRPVTRTGMILGTVGYMSPEQATGDPGLDARTDVFALGCVLFECLTGEAAFSGEHVVAVLAKVLREEAPRLRQRRPDLPPRLDDLVARMLSKEKARRPADGAAVLAELIAIENVSSAVPPSDPPASEVLSTGERRLLVVILAVVPDAPERLRDVVERHGGTLARLANGTLLITLSSRGATSGQVVVAAGCALELSDAFPGARIALATGIAQTSASAPTGPVIDKAASLLAGSMFPGIRLDEVTLSLLGGRFDVRQHGAEQLLSGRRSDIEAPRTLLGKVTPCIGRDKERALIEATLHECVDESVARAVLVTGPPGQGKSRLRYELVAAARKRGDIAILTARADPIGAGSAFMLVRQLIRQAIGLRGGDPSGEQHAKLRAHVASICEKVHSERIADFLGELIGVPSVEHASPQLRAARNDPQIMAGWLRRSFAEWLTAECSTRPILVVLEDLHWGDLPSVTYLDAGLRGLATKPFMLLALARPEVHESFANLWAGAPTIEVPLGRLTRRAAERLVRTALGDEIAQGKRILFPGNHAEDSERVIGFPTSYLSLLRDAFA